jgi:Domain of unknown function (DUF4157)
MRDYTLGRKKAATSTFSNPSLVSPHTPTLANPVRGFGLPTNNIIQTQTAETTDQQQAQAADEKSKLLQALQQPSFGHDISRIALRRPQAKLTVGEPGDKYEQEADWMANQVMRMVVPDKLNAQSLEPVEDSLQRKCTACEQEEDKIQTKPSIQTANDGGLQAGDNIESRLNSSKGGGSALPDEVRSFMEPRFGADFSQVRVHTGSEAVQMNRELEAQAFTHSSDIYYGGGKSPGNNDLTAHELTHVVQQTGGAVQRQSTDGVLARRESLALQMRSQLRTSSLSRLTIQRAITTSGGEWNTDQYDLRRDEANGAKYPSHLGIRGVDMKLKFTPENNVDAELIGLTQSVQAFVSGSASYTNPTNKSMSIKSADAININTGSGETDEGTAIDRLDSRRSPIYGTQNTRSGGGSENDLSSYDSGGNNQYGYRYTDATGLKQKDAWLFDGPTRSGAAKDSRHIFETTALATKGAQAGTYYGSVRWGWRTDSTGNFTKIPLEKVSDGVPSSTFIKAAEIWNAAKTSTGADTVDLPVVDVKITTAPMTGVYPAGFVGPTLSIPAGTRVQIIRNAIPPRVTGQIKVVDGVFTGNTLEVTLADMANLRDERA